MSQFEYSLYSVGSGSTVIPCESINDDNEDGKQIIYVDSLNSKILNTYTMFRKESRKYYKFKIKKKSKAEEGDKFLIHFKLEFNAEKYHENELIIINQWKLWHESIAFDKFSKELEFFSIKNNLETIRDLSDFNTLSNRRKFLWDFAKTECEFDVHFGCHSTQFPIQLNNGKFVGSLFVLSVEVYSVASKSKLDSTQFKLKISRTNSSQFKLDSGFQEQELTTETLISSLSEQNLQELLCSLNVGQIVNSNQPELPSFGRLQEVKLDQGLFSYRIPNIPTETTENCPISEAYFKSQYKYEQIFQLEIENLHFNNFYHPNELIKTVVTLEFNHLPGKSHFNFQEKTITDWEQNWVDSNAGKVLLKYQKCIANDTILFDAYTVAYNQFCLIWLPSAFSDKLSVQIYIDDNLELKQQQNFESILRVESFLISNNEQVDDASCKLNFIDDFHIHTNKEFCLLNSAAPFLIGRVLYISVDEKDYKHLVFPNTFVDASQSNEIKLQAKLIDFIRKAKNMDNLFEIRTVSYLKSNKDTQKREFKLKYLKAKTVLKCTLSKVEINEAEDPSILPKYDVDLIDQEEHYLKAYI